MKHIVSKLEGDRIIWLVVVALSLLSLLAVYSSTGTLAYKYHSGNTEYYILKHFTLMVFGLFLMYMAHLVPYRYYAKVAQLLLILSIPLLIYTLFFGTNKNDANRWITLPIINLSFQTSDLAKVALIMFLARTLSLKQDKIKSFKEAFLPLILPVFAICALIAPANLSTALILFMTSLLLMFIGRVYILHILGLIGISALVGALFVSLLFALPEKNLVGRMPTWKKRIEAFASKDGKEQFQVTQSKVAIAKGMIFGKGPGQSTQRNYLPHPYSDFIYAIIIEEYGIIGGVIVLVLYLVFLFRIIRIVVGSPKAFGALLAVGLGLSLVIQALINMAVAVNLLPVTGQPLPFISMGGTSLFFTSFAVGIILSVSRSIEKGGETGEVSKPSTGSKDDHIVIDDENVEALAAA
ncbi:MAG: FtsW/RodA/SpoVE family cell cycle protein [Chitinophagales bacterium]|nr:FtsW/RodA/SpoVE family cell cycle protein [Chitinophagales bacterium]